MLSFLFLLFFSDDNPSSNLLQGALGSFPVAQGKKYTLYTSTPNYNYKMLSCRFPGGHTATVLVSLNFIYLLVVLIVHLFSSFL